MEAHCPDLKVCSFILIKCILHFLLSHPTPLYLDDLKCCLYVFMMFFYKPCLGREQVLSCKWTWWSQQEVSYWLFLLLIVSYILLTFLWVVVSYRKRKSRSRSRSPGSRKKKSRSRSKDRKKSKKRSRSRERKQSRSKEHHRSRSRSKDRTGRYKARKSPV